VSKPAAQSARTAGKVCKVGKERAPRNAFASFGGDGGNEEPDAESALLNSFSRLAVSDAAQGIPYVCMPGVMSPHVSALPSCELILSAKHYRASVRV
jgi:hypothetical protein